MTDEIMTREDRSGKVWAFLGGCIAGIAGLLAVALISEQSPTKQGEIQRPSSTAKDFDIE